MVYMMTTTITIHDKTKGRLLSYGNMGESYNDVVNRLLDENLKMSERIDCLISTYVPK